MLAGAGRAAGRAARARLKPRPTLEPECTCRCSFATSSRRTAVEAPQASNVTDSSQPGLAELQKIDSKGKGREVETEVDEEEMPGAEHFPLDPAQRKRFMRQRFGQGVHESAHPAAGDGIYLLPQDEVLALFQQAIRKETSHPVRDTWRAFGALSIDSRRKLPARSMQTLLRIQLARKMRKYGSNRLWPSAVGERTAEMFLVSDDRWPLDSLKQMLAHCFEWDAEIQHSRGSYRPNVDGLLSNLTVIIQGFTEHRELGTRYIQTQIHRAVSLCYDLLVLYPPRAASEASAGRKQALSLLSPWIQHFWLARESELDGEEFADVQGILTDVILLLEKEGLPQESEDLAFKATGAGFDTGNSQDVSSEAEAGIKAKRRADALTVVKAYHSLIAQGQQPDSRLYRHVLRDFRRYRGEGIPFPELRLAAQASVRETRQEEGSILGSASPEQMFRLAIETRDFELALSLYNLLRAHHSFTWQMEDARVHRVFFNAVCDYAFREKAGPTRPGDLQHSLRTVTRIYLDFRQDLPEVYVDGQVAKRLLLHILPKIEDTDLILDALHAFTRQQGAKPLGQIDALRFFRRLHRYHAAFAVEGEPFPSGALEALAYFHQHEYQRLALSTGCYNAALRSLADDPGRSMRVFYALKRNNGLMPDRVTYDLLIANLAKDESVAMAKKLLGFFGEMGKEKILPTAAIYRAAIKAYRIVGKEDKAAKVAQFCESVGVDLQLGTTPSVSALPATVAERQSIAQKIVLGQAPETAELTSDPMTPVPISLDYLSSVRRQSVRIMSDVEPSPVVLGYLPTIMQQTVRRAAQTAPVTLLATVPTSTDVSKARLAVPSPVSSPGSADATLQSDGERSWQGGRQGTEDGTTKPLPALQDSPFLATFFTSNKEQEISTAPPRSVPQPEPVQLPTPVIAAETPRQNPEPAATRYTPSYRPPLPVSFASMGVPAVSQAFSTSSRPSLPVGSSAEAGLPNTVSTLPSLSDVGSALFALPYYLADMTFPQLTGLVRRYKLEMEAIEQERVLQETLRAQVAQRADENRWKGWREAGAVPWY